MCFTGEMSASFAAIGLVGTWYIYHCTGNKALTTGIFFFFTMELLQAVQYLFIATGLQDPICDTLANRVLTLLGFLHICFQPYFCHLINESITTDKKYFGRFIIVKRLCLIGAALIIGRHLLSYFPAYNTMNDDISTEWLRGSKICTYKSASMHHLAWSVPFADPSYYVPGAALHSFLMFAPFLAFYEKKGMILQGCILFFSGPVMAAFISDNLMEQPSIWCLFSLAQMFSIIFFTVYCDLLDFDKKILLKKK